MLLDNIITKTNHQSIDVINFQNKQIKKDQLNFKILSFIFIILTLLLFNLASSILLKITFIISNSLIIVFGNLAHSVRSSRRKRSTTINPKVVKKANDDLKPDLVFDLISFILIIVVFVYLTFIIVNFNQSEDPEIVELGQDGLIVSVLALVGFVLMLFFATVGSKDEKLVLQIKGFDRKAVSKIAEGIAIASFGIAITNIILFQQIGFQKYAVSGADLFAFTVLIAIVEELLFTFLFQISFRYLFKSNIVGIIARGIGFSLYHLAVYSADWRLMLSTFLGGIFLAIALERSDRLTTNMIVHIIINIIASAPYLVGTFTTTGG